jgi:hypothetical protein
VNENVHVAEKAHVDAHAHAHGLWVGERGAA